jgi:hypothetical protein
MPLGGRVGERAGAGKAKTVDWSCLHHINRRHCEEAQPTRQSRLPEEKPDCRGALRLAMKKYSSRKGLQDGERMVTKHLMGLRGVCVKRTGAKTP